MVVACLKAGLLFRHSPGEDEKAYKRNFNYDSYYCGIVRKRTKATEFFFLLLWYGFELDSYRIQFESVATAYRILVEISEVDLRPHDMHSSFALTSVCNVNDYHSRDQRIES
jgi:hypothetical protein